MATVTVSPAAATKLLFNPSLTTAPAGTNFNVTVVARDPFGNTATSYTGTVHFSSSNDPRPMLPADYTFTTGASADNGSPTFPVPMGTAGSRQPTVQDGAQPGRTDGPPNTFSPAA